MLVIVLLAGGYLGYRYYEKRQPSASVAGIVAACQERDVIKFQKYVNLDAVISNALDGLKQKITPKSTTGDANEMQQFGAALGQTMVGLAFAIAASANFPALLLSIFWKGMSTAGAVAAITTGTVAATGCILLSPTVWVSVFGNPEAIFPWKNPALLSMPYVLRRQGPGWRLFVPGVRAAEAFAELRDYLDEREGRPLIDPQAGEPARPTVWPRVLAVLGVVTAVFGQLMSGAAPFGWHIPWRELGAGDSAAMFSGPPLPSRRPRPPGIRNARRNWPNGNNRCGAWHLHCY